MYAEFMNDSMYFYAVISFISTTVIIKSKKADPESKARRKGKTISYSSLRRTVNFEEKRNSEEGDGRMIQAWSRSSNE